MSSRPMVLTHPPLNHGALATRGPFTCIELITRAHEAVKTERRCSRAAAGLKRGRSYISIRRWRRPLCTASARLAAPSLRSNDSTWNLTVCCEMPS
jgi:hypothetical protein